MKKDEPMPKVRVVYLRLNSYYIGYMKVKYGVPCLFPAMSALSLCLERYLVNNPTLRLITPFCHSEAAFHAEHNGTLLFDNVPHLTAEERASYLPIAIPNEIIRPSGTVSTSATWQLSAPGTKMLRKQVKRDFWVAFSDFYDDCRYRAQRQNSTVTLDEAISDFASIYNIDMKEADTIYRNWFRLQKNMKAEIEDRRELMEKQSNNVLFYTE